MTRLPDSSGLPAYRPANEEPQQRFFHGQPIDTSHLASSPELHIQAEAAATGTDKRQKTADVEQQKLPLSTEERVVIDKVEHHADVDEDDERSQTGAQSHGHQQGADPIGNQRIDQAGMRSDMKRIGKVRGHLRKVRDFFHAMPGEKVNSTKKTQYQQPEIAGVGT